MPTIELDGAAGAVYLQVIGESVDNSKPPAVWNVVKVFRNDVEIFKYSKQDSQNDRFLVAVDPMSLDGTRITLRVAMIHEDPSPKYRILLEQTQDGVGKKDCFDETVTLVQGVALLETEFAVKVK
jgi:hypothetical protein